jgi:hypothetical protein
MRQITFFVASAVGVGLSLTGGLAQAAGLCGNIGVSTIDLSGVSYDPFDNQDQQKIVNFTVSGPSGQTVWLRVATPIGNVKPRAIFEGQTAQADLDDVSGPPNSNPPSNLNVLNRNWVRVTFPTSGTVTVPTRLTLKEGANLQAGSYAMGLDMRVACEREGRGRDFIEDMSVPITGATVRVPTLIGLADINRNTINLGTLPVNNPENWTGGNGDNTWLSVRSTGDFAITVLNSRLILNHVGSSGPRTSTTQIPYDLIIGGVKLESAEGSRREVGCRRDSSLTLDQRQRVEIRPVLPANSAAGKLAGNYRDVVTLSVSSSELAAATGDQSCS